MPNLTIELLSNGNKIENIHVSEFYTTQLEGGCVIANHSSSAPSATNPKYFELDTVRIKWADGSCPNWHKDFLVIIPGDTGSSVFRFLGGSTLAIVFKSEEKVLVVERNNKDVSFMSNLIAEIEEMKE